ncbi:glutaminyl-tRNA synthetase [Paenibacillus cellulosilyticus]|uniref:Glutamine--tRNA ligase n=1 Tax=Paenibacillus cellulosilyticus TaxID=375489 RepID=A0A2V2YQT0_9BACL|nr:glutamine--tRNA ligase/YqeY domain fusion protein [Paenibacillus cellulosilyticus]PWV99522.1 glutaminyl-tRNA synthetase [Paenibacillus cellulosilyticus]QKS44774.1 glutamine--tRNA ligase/YqeY domain fusion protein [Paenibacillus cellulosilyticus]
MNVEKEHVNEHFLDRLIHEELERSPFDRDMCTRFPPEPNGYLHIGSAYAIHTNYTMAHKHGGKFHLRFDDTNPLKEDLEYVNAIIGDIKWLGYDPGSHIYYGSDYSETFYNAAVTLIKRGKAFICDLSADEMTAYRGTLTEPGRNSPYRDRTVAENLDLLTRMRDGEFPNGAKTVRARIDMSSPNMNMRDPVLYRIIHAEHYRTGNEWCIYPMYDFAHPIQDAVEGITYSLCSIEFKDHRPLYEWVLNELDIAAPPRQREFGRLNLTGVVTSKRFLRTLVRDGYVDGWDDPRLPTLQGLRRRGFTPSSIRSFVEAIGGIRTESTVDISLLDHCLRQDLKETTTSLMAVIRPLKVVITNYPEGETEMLSVENNSDNKLLGSREVPWSRTLYIEREDFMEEPSPGFHRLVPGGEVRLKGAYFIRCEDVIKDPDTGEVVELHCSYDPITKSGTGFTGRKVKGTIHWVCAAYAVKADVQLYEKLLLEQDIPKTNDGDWADIINPESKVIIRDVLIEPSVADAISVGVGAGRDRRYQFMRHGYFCVDTKLTTDERLTFNRIVPLKDSWNRK